MPVQLNILHEPWMDKSARPFTRQCKERNTVTSSHRPKASAQQAKSNRYSISLPRRNRTTTEEESQELGIITWRAETAHQLPLKPSETDLIENKIQEPQATCTRTSTNGAREAQAGTQREMSHPEQVFNQAQRGTRRKNTKPLNGRQ